MSCTKCTLFVYLRCISSHIYSGIIHRIIEFSPFKWEKFTSLTCQTHKTESGSVCDVTRGIDILMTLLSNDSDNYQPGIYSTNWGPFNLAYTKAEAFDWSPPSPDWSVRQLHEKLHVPAQVYKPTTKKASSLLQGSLCFELMCDVKTSHLVAA